MIAEELHFAEAEGEKLPDDVQNEPLLLEKLTNSVKQHPNHVAIVSAHQPGNLLPLDSHAPDFGGKYVRWTYSQLQERVDLLASSLASYGVLPGMSIVCALHNRAEFVLAMWTSFNMGCPFMGLNPTATSNTKEFGYILGLTQPAVIMVENESLATQLESSLPEAFAKVAIKIAASSADAVQRPSGWYGFHELVFGPAPPRPDTLPPMVMPDFGFDAVQVIMFTSGEDP